MSKRNDGFRQVKVRDHVYQMLMLAKADMQEAWDRAEPVPGHKCRAGMTDVIEQLLSDRGRVVPSPKPKGGRKK